jgi:hypothetical protein
MQVKLEACLEYVIPIVFGPNHRMSWAVCLAVALDWPALQLNQSLFTFRDKHKHSSQRIDMAAV